MIYRRLGFHKVNRDARVKTWTRIYWEHARHLLIWGIGLTGLFLLLFWALVNYALKVAFER
jgi:hypothetical protein